MTEGKEGKNIILQSKLNKEGNQKMKYFYNKSKGREEITKKKKTLIPCLLINFEYSN